jgi:hypothetical protein
MLDEEHSGAAATAATTTTSFDGATLWTPLGMWPLLACRSLHSQQPRDGGAARVQSTQLRDSQVPERNGRPVLVRLHTDGAAVALTMTRSC